MAAAHAAENRAAARQAGLRYVFDHQPGIRRTASRSKDGAITFVYHAPDGSRIKDADTLTWIKSLVIPPAWTDVWISPIRNGHLLATGRDVKGRKQYRYHPRWRIARDGHKYGRMLAFAAALPRIRERVDHDLSRPGLPREKVLATVVHLLEQALIRVGNSEYARTNKSFGLTTMRNRHVDIVGSSVSFDFRGKSGKRHKIRIADRRLARVLKACRDLPGYELFQYLDADGTRHRIDSGDVNDYLREITGEDFTAKDFRTWAGTVLAATALAEEPPPTSETAAKRQVAEIVRHVAERLGNTPAVCRKCYVHPEIITAFHDGRLQLHMPEVDETGLRPEEQAVAAFLSCCAENSPGRSTGVLAA